VEEEIVDYEPWMDDYGRVPGGVEFDADDQMCSLHPEVWLSSSSVKDIRDEADRARKEAEAVQAKKDAKKEGKKNKMKQKQSINEPSIPVAPPPTKKGIANKKNRGILDDLDDVDILNDEFDLEDADFLDENFDDLGLDFSADP
jgi:hypothetical protein